MAPEEAPNNEEADAPPADPGSDAATLTFALRHLLKMELEDGLAFAPKIDGLEEALYEHITLSTCKSLTILKPEPDQRVRPKN